MRTYANDPIAFTLEGPGNLIGDNPFALIGGTGAVWVRAGEEPAVCASPRNIHASASRKLRSTCFQRRQSRFSLPGRA